MGDTSMPKDTSWIRSSFLSIGSTDKQNLYYQRRNTGFFKYTDTTLGGNFAINAPYQFCRYADIKEPRATNAGRGMGRWYSEHIDEYGHNVHFRVGIPAYNSILNYLFTAVDGYSARYVSTGREPGFFDAIGTVTGIIISAAFWEISLLTILTKAFIKLTSSRFYYLKPTMFQYWKSVQTILNSISANLRLTSQAIRNEAEKTADIQGAAQAAEYDGLGPNDNLSRLPSFFGKSVGKMLGNNGDQQADIGVDIHAVATRAQALQVQQQYALHEWLATQNSQLTPDEFMARFQSFHTSLNQSVFSQSNGMLNPYRENRTMIAYQKQYSGLQSYRQDVSEDTSGKSITEQAKDWMNDTNTSTGDKIASWFKETVDSWEKIADTDGPKLSEIMLAELRDGSAWFSFRVDNAADPVSESFSNSSEDSEIAQQFNSWSSAIQKVFFNMGGGKTNIPFIDSAIEAGASAVGDALTGMAGTVPFLNPLLGLLNGAQIEVPKRWSSSSSSLPSGNFTFKLKAGYGNTVSIYQDLYVPLAMLLTLALPRGTGPQSYAQPFYLEYYSKGRSQTRIGIVSSLQITRGTGNMGWTKSGLPLGIDVTMTIEDMTKTMFTPPMSSMNILDNLINPMEENAMGDYIAVLSGLGFLDQTYFLPRMKRGWYMLVNQFDSWMSPYRWTGMLSGNFLSNFAMMTERH